MSLARLRRLTGEGDPSALLERALRIQESVLGHGHPALAPLLTDLAKAKQADPRASDEALSLAARALAIRLITFGKEHPLYGESLANVGDQWWSRGQPQMARPLYEEAAGVMEKALGADHPALAHVLLRLALNRFLAEDERGALEAALRTERISAAHLSWTIGSLAEDEALRFSATRISALDLALSLVSRGAEDTAGAAVWDSVIRSRAAVLDEMATRKRGVGTGPGAVAASQELTQASRHLAHLIVRATSEDDGFDQYQRLITEAREKRDKTERTLAGIVAPGRRRAASRRAGLAETLAALPARSALVAFTKYRQLSRASDASSTGLLGTASYLAFVWSDASSFPRVVPVGSAQGIDALVENWRREGARPLLDGGRGDLTERTYRAAATNLRRRVWDPIEPLVRGAERVFLVPDGSLNLLNWAALPVGETDYLVDGGPKIHYLSAERDLIGFTASRPTGRGLLAVGEPAFDDGRLFSAWISAKGGRQKGADNRGTQVAALRGGVPDCGPVGTLRFEPLPASGREAAAVVDLWARGSVEDAAGALRLTANEASEAAFKKMASGRRVLHLATHGFFLDSRCSAPAMPGQRGVGGLAGADLPETAVPDASLRLAGLALAGANQRRWAGPKEEDGILTAEEIATLDLSGVEWAVLSACNTGVGTVRAGEGVLGLRRAFEVAGAGTLIMSLWPVEDEAAGQWMRGLYRARLEHGLATDEAVRSASRDVLNERRLQGLDTHPHSWAGFVAAGDWR